MTPRPIRTLLIALICCLVWLPTTEARPQVDWDQPLNLSLAEANLGQVLKSFAKIAGGTLIAEHRLDGEVTMDLGKTPFSEALDRICREHALRCEWREKTARLSVFPATEGGFRGLSSSMISIELVGASLQQTLSAMTVVSGGAVEIEGDFEGKVTLAVKNVAWQRALELLCADSGCTVDWSADPVLVSPRGDGDDEVTVELDETVDEESIADGAQTLRIRFRPAAGGEVVESIRTFDWSTPVWRMAAGDLRLHMAWLPFETPHLLKLAERCSDDAWPTAMAPIPWRKNLSSQGGWAGGQIELQSVDEADAGADANADTERRTTKAAALCPVPPASLRLYAVIREVGRLVSETELPTPPGSYLMVEPAGPQPPIGAAQPVLAVVRTGHRRIASGTEEHRVLLVGMDGDQPTLREIQLLHGTPHIETFGAWSLELSLRAE